MSSSLVLYEKGFESTPVTTMSLDAWAVGRKPGTVPCLFSVKDREQAFHFISELSLFGNGGRTYAVMNGQRFEVLFTDGHSVIPREWQKLGNKARNLKAVIVYNDAVDAIPQAGVW
jgi:hypothetical protein